MRKETLDKRLVEIYEILADNIFTKRGKMSQEELSKRAGVSRETISAVENKKAINTDSLFKIAQALGVHPCDLLRSSRQEEDIWRRIEMFIEMKIKEMIRRR